MTRNAVHEHIASADPIIANSVHRDMVVDRVDSDECTVADDFYEEEDVAHCYDEEVAKAKIKLFLRLWRRRCARRRELREQNRLAADAALNSLSVGPPIQRKHDRQNTYERLDIDEMMNKRYKKHDESWSSFSVSDLVAGMLCEQNPHSSCICWKAALCYGTHKTSGTGLSNHGTYSSADQWLHSKLMPSSKDECSDDLVLSSPGIAIWKKWITEQSQSSCVLSVIKSIDFSKMNEDVVGSNGLVFLLSEGIELETQKLHFQNLVASIPSGSCTPLLILSASHEEDFDDQSSAVADKLGLHELDKSRICSFLIVHLHESQDTKKHDGYFSDKRLREGLEWLASKSRPQPILWSIKTRELAQSHLNSSLDAVDHMVGPNQCITAFNEALDKSVEDIVAAASANPNSWPCPELSLLHDADEYGVSKLLLPRIGWSSAEAIEPLVSALRYCKLPVFLDDMSFLKRGSMAGEELEEQRLHLQDCLISYLNQSSKMMNLTMSMKEANMMLQKNTRLELHKKHYYLVPNWVLIFRRVFNWRLNILTTRSCSKAYILEKHTPPEKGESFNLVPETWHPSYITHPSLDEMMEVIFAGQPNKPNDTIEDSPMEEVRDHSAQVQSVQDVDIPLGSNMKESRDSSVLPVTEGRETDRLTQLLEQCNMVQHKIGEKLSIYF